MILMCIGLCAGVNFATDGFVYVTVGEGESTYVVNQHGHRVDFETKKDVLEGSFYYENTIFAELIMRQKEMNGQVVNVPTFLYGIKNYKNELIEPPVYDRITEMNSGYQLVNGAGLRKIDSDGGLISVVPFDLPESSRIVDEKFGSYIYEIPGGAQGRIDADGTIVETAHAARLTYLSESVIHYHVNAGLLDSEMAGIYGVQIKDVTNGQTLLEYSPGTMGHKVGQNLYAVRNSIGQWTLIDYDGFTLSQRSVSKTPYVNIGIESEGLISFAVRSETGSYLWGYMDRTEKVVIPPKFSHGMPFNKSFAVVSIGDKKGMINRVGTFVISPEVDGINHITKKGIDYYVISLGDYTGLMSSDFHWLIKPTKYTYVNVMSDGIYVVQKTGSTYQTGLLDLMGEVVFPCAYTSISRIEESTYLLTQKDRSTLLDKVSGQEKALPYANARGAGYGKLAVSNDGRKWAIATLDGQVLTEMKYDRIGMFRDYSTTRVK